MAILDDIFNEYVRMRDNGLDAKDTLRALRPYVEPLPKPEKETLAKILRDWERGDDPQAAQNQPKSSVIKPLRVDRATDSGASAFTEGTDMATGESNAAWVSCSNCGKKNRTADVFCYACGHMLEMPPGEHDTRHFEDADNTLFPDDYFGPDSVMIMHVRDGNFDLELRPQLSNHEVIIGRSTGNSAMAPDVDMAELGAAELGVSRLHLSLTYESDSNAIRVYDLGSANGSYINGQKLHPKEVRMLRNGDELRLGRLIMIISFQHPGNEVG